MLYDTHCCPHVHGKSLIRRVLSPTKAALFAKKVLLSQRYEPLIAEDALARHADSERAVQTICTLTGSKGEVG
jgi:hypothetical protein